MKKTLMSVFLLLALIVSVAPLRQGASNSIERNDRTFRPSPYSYKLLGDAKRSVPEIKDGGLPLYPIVGKGMPNATLEQKEAVNNENNEMFNYDKIDEAGNLYKDGVNLNKKLFKHSSADGQIGGALPATAKAVSKKVHIIPNALGNNPTGLYAPPGEVVTIIFNQADASRNIRCDIGMGSARGGSVVIPTNRDFSRMPSLRKHIDLNSVVNYIGSPLGGPIYLNNEGDNRNSSRYGKPYDVTIIGAVETPHYYLGYTTDEEWERLRQAPGTIFDMDIYSGVRMTMPSSIIRNKSAENMRKVADFWEKASAISNNFGGYSWYVDKPHPITQIYDTHIPAGAAVAFVGADFSCIPIGWANGVMNFESFVLNGSWGDIHEFNHHHQGWGAEGGGEVTNNVLNIIAYMLHTNIGAQRTETAGLSGWNAYTSAYLSLKDLLGRTGKSVNTSLSMYTTLIHSFGDEAMLAASKNTGERTNELWYKSASKAMGYNLTYYFEELCGFTLSSEAKSEIAALNMPTYVPIANTYQAGNNVLVKEADETYARKDIMMGKPFYIPFGQNKELDLNAYMMVPEGVEFEIKDVTLPTQGDLVKGTEIGKYTYTPDKKATIPDEFRVTVGLKFKNNPTETIEDVTLIMQFMQDYAGSSGELRTNPGFSDIDTALNEGLENLPSTELRFSYAGADTKVKNSILTSEGKIVLPDGKYKFFIRGNEKIQLFTGTDQNNLKKSASITEKLDNYDRTRAGSFFEVDMKKSKPLYYKMYIIGNSGRIGYEDYSQIQGAAPVPEEGELVDSKIEVAPITDLPTSAVLYNDANSDAPPRTNFTSEIKYGTDFKANGIILADPKNFEVSSAPPMYQKSDPNNVLDGKFDTVAHSATDIKFPVEFVIDMKSPQSFNLLNLYSREANSSRARVKELEVHSADNIVTGFTKIYEGTAENVYKTTLKFDSNISARYLKIVIKSVYAENYICFSEIQIGSGISNAVVAPATSKNIVYKGDWNEETYGNYLNGSGLSSSGNASAEINFHGTDFTLFAATGRKFGNGKIRIDGGEWQDISFYSNTTEYGKAVYCAANLKDGYHKVELQSVKGDVINVDYFGIAPTVEPQSPELGLWWIVIGLAVAIVCFGIGAGGYFGARSMNHKYPDFFEKNFSKSRKKKGKNLTPTNPKIEENTTSITSKQVTPEKLDLPEQIVKKTTVSKHDSSKTSRTNETTDEVMSEPKIKTVIKKTPSASPKQSDKPKKS